MSWLKVQIEVDEAMAAALEAALTTFGAVSIGLADAADQPILEPAPGATPLWQRIRLTALFDPDVDETTVRLAVASAMEQGVLPEVTFDIVENEDWVARLREELTPLQFGEHLWVCPPGKTCPDPAATVIAMEPGLAFGTGAHPTTSLCLEWLADNPPRERTVLDFGCGSGILAIASLALGASRVTGVDIDRQALTATRENARRNIGGERLDVRAPEELDDATTFDVLMANILSGTVIELAPTLRKFCHSGTNIALSGILTQQAETVVAVYRAWCDMNAPIIDDGWVLLTGTVI
ncbi:MAG: 50S ribosomal protein L11 methyltransferase [Gammaproteobacteria bacterium]|nr:50S ribosomal protein L11 methyltransferase [Gammaproteobacteria bacterium]NND37283.1 50S ribosomal protein L11 methyltransferase [Gammaproteobacteria bacterium]